MKRLAAREQQQLRDPRDYSETAHPRLSTVIDRLDLLLSRGRVGRGSLLRSLATLSP